MISPEAIKRLQAHPDWQAVVAHVEDCIRSLDIPVSSLVVEGLAAEIVGTDVIASQRAIQILHELMAPFAFVSAPSRDPMSRTQGRTGLN